LRIRNESVLKSSKAFNVDLIHSVGCPVLEVDDNKQTTIFVAMDIDKSTDEIRVVSSEIGHGWIITGACIVIENQRYLNVVSG